MYNETFSVIFKHRALWIPSHLTDVLYSDLTFRKTRQMGARVMTERQDNYFPAWAPRAFFRNVSRRKSSGNRN